MSKRAKTSGNVLANAKKSAHTVRDLTRDGMRRVESAYRQEAHAGLLLTRRKRSPLPRKGEQGAYTVRVLRCVAEAGGASPATTAGVSTRSPQARATALPR